MAILKLPNTGDTHTGHVTACEVVAGTYGQQVKFTFASGDLLFLPKDSADRQLARLEFGDAESIFYDGVPGSTLRFSRDPNPKPGAMPYWGIAIAAPREARPKATPKRLPGPGDAVPGHAPDAPPPDDPDAASGPAAAPETAMTAAAAEREARLAAIDAAYVRAWGVAHGTQGEDSTAEAVQAGAATLMISYKDAGLLR